MKIFRLIGMALLAIMMCVNFASCSSDDEDDDTTIKDENGIITNQKRLVEIKKTHEDGDTSVTQFSYDSKGRLISVVEDGYYADVINIIWGNNFIIANSKEHRNSATYKLDDGLVRTREYSDLNSSYAYNSSNQLSVWHYDEKHFTNYTWENGRLIKESYRGNDIYENTYSGKTCKGWCPYVISWDVWDILCLAHPELFGMRSAQLPDQCYNKEVNEGEYYNEYFKETYKYEEIHERTDEYTYKLNGDGYVESFTEVTTYVVTYKYSFKDKNGDGIISDDERNVSGTDIRDAYRRVYIFKWE